MSSAGSIRLAIVTGTSTGIGEAVGRTLLARGWTVVGIARRPSPLTHPAYRHITFDLARVASDAAELEPQLAPSIASVSDGRVALVNNAASVEGLMPVAHLDAAMLVRAYAVNVIAPVWLMGLVMRASTPTVAVRIVNVSSGAATMGFPGLAAYGSSKAALRLAGMSLGAEIEASPASQRSRRNVAILSYEPGVVATDMQRYARTRSPDEFPWVKMFKDFEARGMLVAPELPAADIGAFLESDDQPAFAERRLHS